MLNSYPLYNPTTNNLRRNSLNNPLSLPKYRRNSFSPSTPLILSQPTTEQSFLDDIDLSQDSSTRSSQSSIQCVRIIRRNDTAPIQTNSIPNQRRVVRVIRLSNNTSSPSSSSSSNVYIVRKTDLTPTPTVQINPAIQHVIAKNNVNNNTNNANSEDENNQINKFNGATISIFGIEFSVISNANQCASLVQNLSDSMSKPTTTTTTNKINDIHKLFSRIYRCVLCSAEFNVYEDFVSHGSGHLQDLTLKPLETASVFRRRSYRCLLPNCNSRIER